jgi:hypothetical protein
MAYHHILLLNDVDFIEKISWELGYIPPELPLTPQL